MPTLNNSCCTVICVHKKSQLCFVGLQCNSNLLVSIRVFHRLIGSRYDIQHNRTVGNIHQAKPQKVQQKFLMLVLIPFLTH